MEKPISVALAELKNQLLICIQDSQLSPVLLSPVLKEVCELVVQSAEIQIQQELAAYKKVLEEQQKEKTEEEKEKKNEN